MDNYTGLKRLLYIHKVWYMYLVFQISLLRSLYGHIVFMFPWAHVVLTSTRYPLPGKCTCISFTVVISSQSLVVSDYYSVISSQSLVVSH